MSRYRVRIPLLTQQAIADYARYIAKQSGSKDVARAWADKVYDTIDLLDHMPRRFNLAEENAHRDYEIRRQIIGNYLALYNVDDDTQTVHVIGFRHGARLPRPDELPNDPQSA